MRPIWSVCFTLLALLGLSGCNQETVHIPVSLSSNTSTTTYSISGTVLDGTDTPLPNVTLELDGAASASTASDADGHYTFGSLAAGDYTISATRSGYEFAIVSQAVTILEASVENIDFVGAALPPPSFSIAGRVMNDLGGGMSLVAVTLSGSKTAAVTSDGNGNYIFENLSSGTYTVTPTLSNSAFTPLSQVVRIVGNSAAGINFIAVKATVATYSVSGRVATGTGAGVADVSLTIAGSETSVSTDANGDYTISGLANGTYTIVPSLTDYSFLPTNLEVTVSNADLSGKNFTATPPTFSLSGRIVDSATPPNGIPGVSITLGGADSATSDLNGGFTFTGLNGTYTVTPSLTNYTFSPKSTIVSVKANVGGIDFTGTPPVAPAPTTFSISGIVTSGSQVLTGVQLTLRNSANSSALQTVGNNPLDGSYTISGIGAGSYIVTASHPDYTFVESNVITFTANSFNATGIDFVGTAVVPPPITFSISGFVTSGSGAITGVQLTLRNSANSSILQTVTNNPGDGSYTIFGIGTGSYTVTASHPDYTFVVSNVITFTANSSNATGIDFTGTATQPPTPPTYSISGTVVDANGSLSGISISLSGAASNSTTTDGNGDYSFSGLSNGSYTVTPSSTGFNFTPSSRSAPVSNGNVNNIDFTGTAVAAPPPGGGGGMPGGGGGGMPGGGGG